MSVQFNLINLPNQSIKLLVNFGNSSSIKKKLTNFTYNKIIIFKYSIHVKNSQIVLNIYPGEIKGFLRNLYNELKKYEDDPYEKRAFLYLDIISWLESKIDRKPLQYIIKEKAILINRKEKQSTVLS